MKVDVKQGQCRVNSYTTVVDKDDVKIFYFDTQDKYPIYFGLHGHTVMVELGKHSPTYKDRLEIRPTEITFDLGSEWDIVMGETGRYSIYVTVFKKSHWDNEKNFVFLD